MKAAIVVKCGMLAAQSDEGNVLAAGAFNAAAAHYPQAVCKQHDLEQQPRRVGASAGGVVPVADIEPRQVDLVIDQIVLRVFESTGYKLPLEIDGNEARAGVDHFVARHAGLLQIFDLGVLQCHLVHRRMWG